MPTQGAADSLPANESPVRNDPDSVSRILVFGQEAELRGGICHFLTKHGYEPVEASSVAVGATKQRVSPVLATLYDVSACGDGGWMDHLGELRSEPAFSSTPAILITTGSLSPEDQVAVSRDHAFLFHKPNGLSAMIRLLRQISDQPLTA